LLVTVIYSGSKSLVSFGRTRALPVDGPRPAG
jgi:hypothetical protein